MMYRSLVATGCNFKMYVLAMDEKCKEVLDAYSYENQIVISCDNFCEEMGLSEIRKTRKRGEFCWTCTSYLIDYVLTKYGEQICTYVDSDLCFYSNPQCLIDEMGDKTVQIVPHRYNSTIQGYLLSLGSGTYCVQFNTFKNTRDAMDLLHWWEDRCLESCANTSLKNDGVFGDQGYLEHWGEKDNVEVLKNLGGGVAPWNLMQYSLCDSSCASNNKDKRFREDSEAGSGGSEGRKVSEANVSDFSNNFSNSSSNSSNDIENNDNAEDVLDNTSATKTTKTTKTTDNQRNIVLKEKRTGKQFNLIFYHFHNLTYHSAHEANANVSEVWNADMKLIELLYREYLIKVNEIKEELKERFDVYPLLTSHPGITALKKRSILYRIRGLMDRLFVLRIYSLILERMHRHERIKKTALTF